MQRSWLIVAEPLYYVSTVVSSGACVLLACMVFEIYLILNVRMCAEKLNQGAVLQDLAGLLLDYAMLYQDNDKTNLSLLLHRLAVINPDTTPTTNTSNGMRVHRTSPKI